MEAETIMSFSVAEESPDLDILEITDCCFPFVNMLQYRDQICFIYALTFAGSSGRCWKPRPNHVRSLLLHKYNESTAIFCLISGTILFCFFTTLTCKWISFNTLTCKWISFISSFRGQTVYKTVCVSCCKDGGKYKPRGWRKLTFYKTICYLKQFDDNSIYKHYDFLKSTSNS